MNNLIIREINQDDINNGLLDVYIEGYRYHQNGRPDIFKNINNDQLKEDLIRKFNEYLTIVIIDNNKVVGYLSYSINEKNNKKKMYINQLVIKDSYRNKGFGKMLMEEAEKIAKNTNCIRIELDCWLFNDNALEMYEHIGYTKQRIIFEKKIK